MNLLINTFYHNVTVPVGSFEEASKIWCDYRDDVDSGAGIGVSETEHDCGDLYDDIGEFVGRVSYNGRCWDTEENEVRIG